MGGGASKPGLQGDSAAGAFEDTIHLHAAHDQPQRLIDVRGWTSHGRC